jgi:hypothetical protein
MNQLREELKAWSGGKAFTVVADIDCSPRTLKVLTLQSRGRVGSSFASRSQCGRQRQLSLKRSAPRWTGRAAAKFPAENAGI